MFSVTIQEAIAAMNHKWTRIHNHYVQLRDGTSWVVIGRDCIDAYNTALRYMMREDGCVNVDQIHNDKYSDAILFVASENSSMCIVQGEHICSTCLIDAFETAEPIGELRNATENEVECIKLIAETNGLSITTKHEVENAI